METVWHGRKKIVEKYFPGRTYNLKVLTDDKIKEKLLKNL